MKAKRRNPAVSNWGSSGYIVVLPKGEVMADETSKAPSGTTSRWGAAIDKFNAAVAAPLEGTLTAGQFYECTKGTFTLAFTSTRQKAVILAFAEAYAAAVSKSSREELDRLLFALGCQLGGIDSALKVIAAKNEFIETAEARISELERELAELREAAKKLLAVINIELDDIMGLKLVRHGSVIFEGPDFAKEMNGVQRVLCAAEIRSKP